jgi:hypothetical protein
MITFPAEEASTRAQPMIVSVPEVQAANVRALMLVISPGAPATAERQSLAATDLRA